MVGVMSGGRGAFREQVMSLLHDAKLQEDTAAKMDMMGRVKDILLSRDSSLLAEFVPHILEFHYDAVSEVRSTVAEIMEEIALKYQDSVPLVVPVLETLMQDNIPAVVRCAVRVGSNIFCNIFRQVAMQGIFVGHVEKSLERSWSCATKLKDSICSIGKEHVNGGVRFMTFKFLETMIFLFTPDPNLPAESPLQQNWDGRTFNISWIMQGHPILDTESLGQEADRYLTYLLEQVSDETFVRLSGPVAIVLVTSLSTIAKQRPDIYRRITPALTRLGSVCEEIKGPQRASIIHALRSCLVALLRCAHSVTGNWRELLVTVLKAMNAGDLADAAIRQTDRMLRNAERERAFRDYHLSKKDKLHPVDYKRPLQENGSVPSLLNVNSAKRLRATAENSVTSSQDIKIISDAEGTGSTQNPVGLNVDSKLTPLQQMIAMIGALVAKGERAASSIEILITSLPPDMLADVVIENMKNLPTSPPALPSVANVAGSSDAQANMTGSLKADEAPALPPVNIAESPKSVQTAADHRRDPRRDPRRMDPRRSAVPVGGSRQTVSVAAKLEEPVVEPSCSSSGLASTLVLATVTPVPDSTAPVLDIPSVHLEVPEVREEVVSRSITVQPNGSSWREAEISLDQKAFDIPSDSRNENVGVSADSSGTLQLESVALPAASSLVAEPSSIPGPLNTDSQISAAQCTDTAVSPVSFVPTVQVEPIISDQVRSEAVHTLSSTSMAGPAPATPFVPLNDSQQLALWKVLFLRILEKHVVPESACSSNLRFSLLPRLISQCIADEEAIMILQDFILADYHNHKGHELTMHMLYQLYGDKTSGDRAIVASKVYDDFLIAVAQGIRETLPPTDKSLSRLFSEAPMIPVGALKWLESICNPSGTDVVNGERIFQGLSAVWILILLRPPLRAECLEIALKCAVHEVDEVRTKAIRLVANKLYPLPYNSQRIEDFAMSMLYDVVGREHNEEGVKSLGCEAVPQRQPTLQVVNDGEDSLATADKQAMHGNSVQQDRHQGGKVNLSIGEAQRCMSLYFALCTKKVSLLRHLFEMYENAPKAVKQAAHRNMPVLIRTIGSNSSDLLQLLSDPPHGSKNLILLVLHLLTEADPPSHDLIAIVKQLYESKIKDARLLTPILSSLSKAEVLPIFPHLVALPTEDFKAALDRILQGSVHTGPALTPAEVLVAIHAIDPERDHIPLAMVKDACSVCFQQRTVFTQQVLAKVLNQLVEQTPIPMLFMRTVILAVGTFRSLVSFVMEILSRLVSKQIWKWPNLWIGFLKCADQTQPHSFHVLLQLPAVQLDKALHKHPNLRAPLTNYASKPTVRSNLARPVLVVLGLIQDGVSSDPASHSQAVPNATTTILENQIRETTTS